MISGCLSVFCLCLILLIFIFQQPLAHSYLPSMVQLHTDIWQYLLADSTQLLINHAQLNIDEERHMLDVKRLLWWLFVLMPLLVIVFGLSLYCFCRAKVQIWLVGKRLALLGLISLGLVLLATAILGFRGGFIYFHQLLFASGTWWFAPDSALIQVFPLSYFQQFALFFCLLTGLVFTALYLMARQQQKSISSSADTLS